jgi:CheY-like chemotaxis protein
MTVLLEIVIMIDVMLPGTDGFDLCRQLQQIDLLSNSASKGIPLSDTSRPHRDW